MADRYDVIVLGAGPTGENVADRAVRGGLSAAIVESELVGGECSYWACMPSKGLLRPVAAVSEASHVRGASGARLDAPEVLARRDRFASDWKDDGQVEWLKNAGIDLFRGPGRIAGDRAVKVGDTDLRARHAVVIATGSRAVVPPPLAGVNPWTSREATSAHAIPGRLAIVGGGVVGLRDGHRVAGAGRTGHAAGPRPAAGPAAGLRKRPRGEGTARIRGRRPARGRSDRRQPGRIGDADARRRDNGRGG